MSSMTVNSSKELADLLTPVYESVMDVVTAAKTVSALTGDGQDGGEDTQGQLIADDLNYFMSAIVGPVVCLFGLVGNVLSIATWARLGMKTSTGRYLTGQAVANIALLTMFLTCDSIHCWFPEVKYSPAYGEYFSYIGYPMFYFSFMCVIWFTVGITVDRYIMVCWITKAKNLCSEYRATFSLALITVNGFIINIPHFVFYKPVYRDLTNSNNINSNNSNSNNNTGDQEKTVAFVTTEFGSDKRGEFYEFWIHCMILIAIPWIAVMSMNLMIILKLNKANKMMADKKSSQANEKSKKSENQITRLLLAVTFTFLFCNGLQCASHCLWLRKPPEMNWVIVSGTYAFGKTAMMFNASLNFLLYCLTGRRFRVELLKMLRISAKNDGSLSSLLNSSSRTVSTTATATTAETPKDV